MGRPPAFPIGKAGGKGKTLFCYIVTLFGHSETINSKFGTFNVAELKDCDVILYFRIENISNEQVQ